MGISAYPASSGGGGTSHRIKQGANGVIYRPSTSAQSTNGTRVSSAQNEFGAWTELVSAADATVARLLIMINVMFGNTSGPTSMLQLGLGAAGLEGAAMAIPMRTVGGGGSSIPIVPALYIPAGTRLAARVRWSYGATNLDVDIISILIPVSDLEAF